MGHFDGFQALDISIHAPREGSDSASAWLTNTTSISIHAPREGSDGVRDMVRPPGLISIHAPREGSDVLSTTGT